jgi:hypothetical protein
MKKSGSEEHEAEQYGNRTVEYTEPKEGSHPCLLPQILLVDHPHRNASFRNGAQIWQGRQGPIGWPACADGLADATIRMTARSRENGLSGLRGRSEFPRAFLESSISGEQSSSDSLRSQIRLIRSPGEWSYPERGIFWAAIEFPHQ